MPDNAPSIKEQKRVENKHMHIEKTSTTNFSDYDIFCEERLGLFVWKWTKPREIKLDSVLEADDKTGLVIRQVLNHRYEPIFTNGSEDISLSNEVKLLLLVPAIREAFYSNGFRPKTTTSYEKNVRIVNRNPLPSDAIIAEIAEQLTELEPQNA